MSTTEADTIAAVARPATVATLIAELRALGLAPGDVVIVHSSLSALGWVAGGAQAVVEALLASVGQDGTIVMPAQSGQLSDPARWEDPPVPTEWVPIVRDSLPAFDPWLTPTRGMGAVVEAFRAHRDARRSLHPTSSFVAVGPAADAITAEHPLTPSLGETSPLGRLYDLDARVLLLGVDHANNTSLHLAEYRADYVKETYLEGVPVCVDGERRWVTYEDVLGDDSDFAEIGVAFGRDGAQRTGRVGAVDALLMPQRAVVDFAVEWMQTHRG